jgi:malate/lactate dehydrogenase
MLKQVFEAMQPIRTDAILVLVANPVDILTHFAQQLSGLPKSQVFGSGTFLDTVRLRGILAKRFKVGAFSSVVTSQLITSCWLGGRYCRARLCLRRTRRFSIRGCRIAALVTQTTHAFP